MTISYYAIFNYYNPEGIEHGIGIQFPDIKLAYSCASDDEDALHMATDVLSLVLQDNTTSELSNNINDYPPRTELENITIGEHEKIALIELDIDFINKEMPKFLQGDKFIFSFDWFKQIYHPLVNSRIL